MKKYFTILILVVISAFAACDTFALEPLTSVVQQEQNKAIKNDPVIKSILINKLADYDKVEKYFSIYQQQFGKKKDLENLGMFRFGERIYLDYDEYFSSVEWIERDGEVSLSITPNSQMYDSDVPNVLMARSFHSFSLLKERFSSDYRWRNEASLEAQYQCHFTFAGMYKVPWNIEPFRTETNAWSWNMITHKCNP